MKNSDSEKYGVVYVANGQLEAETIRLFLEAHDIKAFIFQEGVGNTYGLTIGPLGEAKVVVPTEQIEQAVNLLEQMEMGEFDYDDTSDDSLSDMDQASET
ncbi:MAG: DUF2007 domain-containing protein [Anaerolineales bacterium]|jgi:hypothetical protein